MIIRIAEKRSVRDEDGFVASVPERGVVAQARVEKDPAFIRKGEGFDGKAADFRKGGLGFLQKIARTSVSDERQKISDVGIKGS